jgi:hypothetical protein
MTEVSPTSAFTTEEIPAACAPRETAPEATALLIAADTEAVAPPLVMGTATAARTLTVGAATAIDDAGTPREAASGAAEEAMEVAREPATPATFASRASPFTAASGHNEWVWA